MDKTYIFLQNNYGGVGPYTYQQIETAMQNLKISNNNIELFKTIFTDKDLVREFGFKLPNNYNIKEKDLGEGSCGGSWGGDASD